MVVGGIPHLQKHATVWTTLCKEKPHGDREPIEKEKVIIH